MKIKFESKINADKIKKNAKKAKHAEQKAKDNTIVNVTAKELNDLKKQINAIKNKGKNKSSLQRN
mgnify:CR=1 FL=1